MKPIEVSGGIRMASIEGLLRRHFRKTLKANFVTFDLTAITSIDLLSAMRLYSWIANLRTADTPVGVRIELPKLEVLQKGQARLLLDSRALEDLKRLGTEVDHVAPSTEVVLSLETLTAEPSSALLERIANQIRAATDELPEEAIRDFSHGVFFELLENAATHGQAKSAYFAGNVVPVDTDDADTFLPSFRASKQYIELTVGDLGPGIEATLGPYMPADYRPPFKGVFSDPERQVLYALEYASTNSPEARLQRLTNYLSDPSLEIRRVATGLCCVLNIVRSRHGQIVVRTPNALVALDYSRGTDPRVNVAEGPLGPVPGTHLLLRFPSRRVSLPTGYRMPLPEAAIANAIDIISPFPDSDALEPARVQAATLKFQQHVELRRQRPGVSLVRGGRAPLTTRAGALFTAELAGMDRGARHVICLDDIANGARLRREPTASDYIPPPAHGTGVLLGGDLFRNSFWSVDYASAEVPQYLAERKGDEFRMNANILGRTRLKYAQSVKSEIAAIVGSPDVRLTDGPFLIEGQYFTNIFFSVTDAICDSATLQLCADWAACVIPQDCDLLIFVTAPVAALTRKIARRYGEMYGAEPAVMGEGEILQGRFHLGTPRKCVAITDVIGRGAVLDAILSAIYPATIRAVVTIVDSRPVEADNDFFEFDMANAERKAKLIAVLREPITTFDTEEGALRERPQADVTGQQSLSFSPRAKIIDPDTHRPTVYTVDDPISVNEIEAVLSVARDSKALRYGHTLYGRRHYAVYLHFERLFRALRPLFENWLRGQFGKNSGLPPRRCVVLNELGSLSWLGRSIAGIDPAIVPEEVTENDLRAPGPPAKNPGRGTTFVILPGSASGDLARRAIEYASRAKPQAIVLLIVTTRMEPAHLSFLSGLSSYRNIRVQVSSFAHLPVRAYPDPSACPLCEERAARQRLAKDAADKFPTLHAALTRSVDALAPLDVERVVDENVFAPTEAELRRVRIRALYEASEHDLNARRILTERLRSDPCEIDHFLEIVAMEHRSIHFSLLTMNRRLLAIYASVRSRVEDLLMIATSPFSIASKLPALAHISPSSCALAASRLINAYLQSPNDLEAICGTLLALRRSPEEADLKLDDASEEARRLISDTRKFVATPPENDDSAAFVESIERVWSVLIRSSLVTVRLPELYGLAERKNPSDTDIQRVALHVYDGWNSELLNLLGDTVLNRHWPFFARRHTQLASDVAMLTDLMHRIRRHAETPVVRELHALADQVKGIVKRLATSVLELFVPPVQSEIGNIPDALPAGARIVRIQTHIAPDIPPIFADARCLNEALREVQKNWAEHASDDSPEVRIDVRRDDEFVIIDLADNFGGSINRESWGGVRVMREFCEAYGGKLRFENTRADGMKAVVFCLRVLHEEVRRNADERR